MIEGERERVRVGFIGCGGNARGHMTRVGNNEHAQIVAVCDVVEELALRSAQQTGSKAYTNYREMLDTESIDCVYISIPVFAHGQLELDVIERRLPFFVEKPVAIDMATALQIRDRLKASGLLTCVGYQLRYCGSTDILRERLSETSIGMIAGKYWCGSGHGDPSKWVRKMEQSGGQLVEQATHTIDMMRFIGGEVAEVFCYQANRFIKEINCADHNVVAMRFRSGAIGSLTTTWAYDPADWSHANLLDILTDKQILQWNSSGIRVLGSGETSEHTREGQNIDDVFVNAVANRDLTAVRSPYEDAVLSLAISLAANESARTGSRVEVRTDHQP